MGWTTKHYEFLNRLSIWEKEVERIGNAACQGKFAGYGHAFGKWKEIACELEDLGYVEYSGQADWFVEGAHVYFLTNAGRTRVLTGQFQERT